MLHVDSVHMHGDVSHRSPQPGGTDIIIIIMAQAALVDDAATHECWTAIRGHKVHLHKYRTLAPATAMTKRLTEKLLQRHPL